MSPTFLHWYVFNLLPQSKYVSRCPPQLGFSSACCKPIQHFRAYETYVDGGVPERPCYYFCPSSPSSLFKYLNIHKLSKKTTFNPFTIRPQAQRSTIIAV